MEKKNSAVLLAVEDREPGQGCAAGSCAAAPRAERVWPRSGSARPCLGTSSGVGGSSLPGELKVCFSESSAGR